MTQLEKFNDTINILVDAYLKNTLLHGNCCACAVGNIVAAKMGYRYIKGRGYSEYVQLVTNEPIYHSMNLGWEDQRHPGLSCRSGKSVAYGWAAAFCTDSRFGVYAEQTLRPEYLKVKIVRDQIAATGYHWKELARIEFAFESAEWGVDSDSWMFNGLMAVVDVLADIHGIDMETIRQSKELFNKSFLYEAQE